MQNNFWLYTVKFNFHFITVSEIKTGSHIKDLSTDTNNQDCTCINEKNALPHIFW